MPRRQRTPPWRGHWIVVGLGVALIVTSGPVWVGAEAAVLRPAVANAPGGSASPGLATTTAPADDRILVTVDPGRGAALAPAVTAAGGVPMDTTAGDTIILDPAPGTTVDTAALDAIPGVRAVEANMRLRAFAAPNDPNYSDQYGLFDSQPAGIRAESAWNGSAGSREVVVGVLDTGIQYDHPDLAANLWSNRTGVGGCPYASHGWDATSGSTDLNARCNPRDLRGHGTLVAGILGAVGNNGVGITGVAQKVSMMSLKMLDANGNGSVADAVEAMDWGLTAKAAGVNLRIFQASWGGYNPAPSEQSALHAAIQRAQNAGVLFVTAAGNGDVANVPYDLDQPGNDVLPCEDSSAAVVCVGASTESGTLASFSNYGSSAVDLAAPGSDILSTIPVNVDPNCPPKSGYCRYGGTSMATPMVSGGAVDILAAEPNLTLSQLKSRILGSVTTSAALTGKFVTNGRFDLCKAMPNCDGRPAVPPTAPTAVSAVVRSGAVDLRWQRPDSNGNSSTISGYDVSGPAGTVSLPLSAASHTITGLADNANATVRIRAVGSGGSGPWITETIRPHPGAYTTLPRGTVNRYATNGSYPSDAIGAPSFPFDIARGIAILPEGTGGYEVDGFGGIHPFRIGSTSPMPPQITGTPYWPGWDIIRGIAISPQGGGFLVDGFGGTHPFGFGAGAPPGRVTGTPYYPGNDLMRGVTLNPTGTGGYLVDAFGGTHSMSISGSAAMPRASGAGYWPGWDIIRGITLVPGTGGGYIVDAFGGTHPFAATGPKPAGPTAGPYSPPLDLARGIST